MAKNPNKKAKALQKDEQKNGAMKFFLAGCVAELYLLIIRRFYINADSELSRIAWYDRYLWMLAGIGAGVLEVGLIAALTAKANAGRRKTGWALAGAGAFVGIASALVRWNMATLSLMTIVVPVVILLGVLWALYDRECALALTVLGVALLALWGYRRYASSMYVGTAVKALVALYLVALIVLAVLTKQGKTGKLLPETAERLPVYISCGLSAVALLAALAIVLSVPVYLALYITYYLTLGMYACVDSVLVQSETPDEVRGTVMSAQSLLQMVGAWLGTGAAGLWLGHGSIPGLWLLCAAVLAGGTAACLVPVWLLRRAKCRAKPLQNV